jgi:hypothetical protein
VDSIDRTSNNTVNDAFLALETDVLGEQELQNRYASRLSIYRCAAGNPRVRKRKCPATPYVLARLDGRYIYTPTTACHTYAKESSILRYKEVAGTKQTWHY